MHYKKHFNAQLFNQLWLPFPPCCWFSVTKINLEPLNDYFSLGFLTPSEISGSVGMRWEAVIPNKGLVCVAGSLSAGEPDSDLPGAAE